MRPPRERIRCPQEHIGPDINPPALRLPHIEWDQKLGAIAVTLLSRGRHFGDGDRALTGRPALHTRGLTAARDHAAVFIQ